MLTPEEAKELSQYRLAALKRWQADRENLWYKFTRENPDWAGNLNLTN